MTSRNETGTTARPGQGYNIGTVDSSPLYFEQLYLHREVTYNNIEQYKQKQDRTDRAEKKKPSNVHNVTKMMMTTMAEAAK